LIFLILTPVFALLQNGIYYCAHGFLQIFMLSDKFQLLGYFSMVVTFAGGAGSIGASCILLEFGNSSIVVDCGIRPGNNKSPLPDLSILNGKSPDAIILSHAHTDHSGALPVLAEYFPHTPIFTTPPTIDLTTILLNDSLKLMNGPDRECDIPLYSGKQVERVIENFVPLRHYTSQSIGDCSCSLYPAGHILGASMVHLTTPNGHVLITGDYSCSAQRTVGALNKPAMPVDLLISESTYGERLHEDRNAAETRFIGQIKEIISREGRVLVPSFAIGRAQEVLLILRKAMRDGRLDAVPVYVDGMVKTVCDVYSKHESFVSRTLAHDIRSSRHPFFIDSITPVESSTQRQQILQGGPCIIVASSGMLSGGASVVYARELLKNERDGILLTGYQDEESPGRALLDLASAPIEGRSFTLAGETIDVKASVKIFGLSAHADRLEMAGFIESMHPRSVVLVHGGNDARESLKRSISCNDCISGFDGLVLEKTYRIRKTQDSFDEFILPEDADIARIREILGPPSHIPVKGRQIAEIWFGTKTKAIYVEQFVCRLIEFGLVRRDDEKSNLLWVLAPSLSGRFKDEADLAGVLKSENPKGKLLEYCMRLKIEFPLTEWGIDGAFHTARMNLSIGGVTHDSGTHHAAERSVAEQLAARELIAQCKSDDLELIGNEMCLIPESQQSLLKARNPKGLLIELLTKQRAALPQFDYHVIDSTWCCRISLTYNNQQYISGWYQAESKIVAQQGASAQVLEMLQTLQATSIESTSVSAGTSEQDTTIGTITTSQHDPRITLNELRQRRHILDYGYFLLGTTGPSHAPVFSVQAWAQFSDQTKTLSHPQQGISKKEAELRAARDLVKMIGMNE
jgi:Cft2 family RNA processing exonuclease